MSILRFFRKKRTEASSDVEPTALLCMILSQRTDAPEDAAVRRALGSAFGREASVDEGNDGVWMLNVPSLEHPFVSFMPAPIPNGEAEDAADSFMWPDGSRFAAHKSHAILGSGGTNRNRIEAVLSLTRLAAAMMEPFEGTAVYWGSGSITVPRNEFIELANEASVEHLPLFLWCRFQLYKPDAEHIGLYTLGLEQFGVMNLEVDESSWQPQELVEFVFNVAHYLVQSGPVIKDGDTVGGSAEQKIVVRHGHSTQDPSRRAYKIVGT